MSHRMLDFLLKVKKMLLFVIVDHLLDSGAWLSRCRWTSTFLVAAAAI